MSALRGAPFQGRATTLRQARPRRVALSCRGHRACSGPSKGGGQRRGGRRDPHRPRAEVAAESVASGRASSPKSLHITYLCDSGRPGATALASSVGSRQGFCLTCEVAPRGAFAADESAVRAAARPSRSIPGAPRRCTYARSAAERHIWPCGKSTCFLPDRRGGTSGRLCRR